MGLRPICSINLRLRVLLGLASQPLPGELGPLRLSHTSTITHSKIHSLYFYFLICKMEWYSKLSPRALVRISQKNMMKSVCSTQQEVCNCFVFTYVSIWKKKKYKHHPGSCHTTMTTGTKALLHPSLEPNYHPKNQSYFTSGKVRGHC